MKAPDQSLLIAAVDWQVRKTGLLSAAGVESRAQGPTTSLSKNSATIEFISSRLLIGVTIWDSGECEAIRDSPDQTEPLVQVIRLADAADVHALLDRLELELTGNG